MILASNTLAAAPKINVEKKGTYVYWFTYKDALGKNSATTPERFKGKTVDADASALGAKFADAKLYVMNKRNGNLAIVDYAVSKDPKSAKPIDIAEEDFQYVPRVQLKIVAQDGAPIESAIVNITDGESTPMRAIVTPADQGVATFENVASGEVGVKVQAKGVKKTIDSDIEIPEQRKEAVFTHEIKVSGDVDTLPIEAKQDSAKKSDAEPKKSGGGFLLQFISGLIFIGVIVAIVAAVIKSKGITAADTLKKLGVELPSDQNAAANASAQAVAPAVDPNKCPFCGQMKDASGNCACSVTPGASPFASPSQGSTGVPRIIGSQGTYSGHIFELSSASVIVGREPGNDIALPNDTTVSRHHATIIQSNGGYAIKDEGSSNGTFVNGAKVTQQNLSAGDEIQIGATKFRFEV